MKYLIYPMMILLLLFHLPVLWMWKRFFEELFDKYGDWNDRMLMFVVNGIFTCLLAMAWILILQFK